MFLMKSGDVSNMNLTLLYAVECLTRSSLCIKRTVLNVIKSFNENTLNVISNSMNIDTHNANKWFLRVYLYNQPNMHPYVYVYIFK